MSLSTPPGGIRSSGEIVNLGSNQVRSILTTTSGASVLTGGPSAAHWGIKRGVGGASGESGMSAEKELELLKAQVQDIARVCKVRSSVALISNQADQDSSLLL